jgi:putative FmdB family regulatory protein
LFVEEAMPIYEYRCDACGHELESLQKMGAAPLLDCPSCHKASLRKLISAAGFQLKGTGWYATDFKSGTKPASASDNSSKEESKTEPAKDQAAKADAASKPDSSAKDVAKPVEKKADVSPPTPASN